ncbi:MAG: ABC transporter permease [Chloroflexi bacterium]|nr:ABC transporter permease [Chloroflexota bacterium]
MAFRTPNDESRFAAENASRGPSRSFWQDTWQRFRRDRLAIAGGLVFLLLCLISLAAPLVSQYVTGYDPDKNNLSEQWKPPTAKHWFGTDEYGRDYFTRIVWAGRVSLSIGFFVAIASVVIGVTLGLIAGYFGGWIDDLLQAVVNVIAAIPFLPLLIIIGSMIRLDALGMAFLLSVLGWTGELRLVRGQVLSVKQRDYVLAARAVGARNGRIMAQHLLPNVFSIVLVILGFDIVGAILTESSLSFLGFGVAPPTATWGNMLTNSLSYYTRAPWLVVFPGIAISLTVLSVYLLADGLRDAMDPRLRR